MPTPIALDTESSYAKDRDIRSLGVAKYIRHPETDHYLVSVYGEGIAYVAPPDKFPWDMLAGADLLSHNAAYDQSVIAELLRRGLPIPQPASWHCTSDLAAYRQSPRSLADAARELLGVSLDKSTRDLMKGRRFNEQSHSVQAQVAEYCLYDSKAAYFLWQQHSEHWPSHEQASSDHTAMMCQRGVAVDLERIARGVETLKQARWECEQQIPWANELDEKGKEQPVTSPLQIAKECRKRNIEVPPCTNSNSEEFGQWLEEHEGLADFVRAISLWRKANRLLNVLETMRDRSIGGILHYSLKYFGASHTGRWSGDAGLNMQNLPRKPFNGVDVRACLVPRPGKVFIVADFAQIEARIASWLAGDDLTLAMLRQGVDIYEAHARRTMGYTDPRPLKDVDNDMRHFAKARCLSGKTLILTEKGYVPVSKLRKRNCRLVWDGVRWVTYDKVQFNGLSRTIKLNGERFTADHQIFVNCRETRPAGQIRKRWYQLRKISWRETPGSDWKDVWALARGIAISLSEEWLSLRKSHLWILRKGIKRILGQLKKRQNNPMQQMWQNSRPKKSGYGCLGETS